jgi:hypothetical protein
MDTRIDRTNPDGQNTGAVIPDRTDRTPPLRGVRLSGRPDLGLKRKYPEQQIQIGVAHHFKTLEPLKKDFTFFAVPNGGLRTKREASLLKAMGVRAGVHDLVFLLPAGIAVLIELKADGGRTSDDQKVFHASAIALGHRSYIVTASDAGQAINQIYQILHDYGWSKP